MVAEDGSPECPHLWDRFLERVAGASLARTESARLYFEEKKALAAHRVSDPTVVDAQQAAHRVSDPTVVDAQQEAVESSLHGKAQPPEDQVKGSQIANPWNRVQHRLAGTGLSRTEVAKLYQQEKKALQTQRASGSSSSTGASLPLPSKGPPDH